MSEILMMNKWELCEPITTSMRGLRKIAKEQKVNCGPATANTKRGSTIVGYKFTFETLSQRKEFLDLAKFRGFIS